MDGLANKKAHTRSTLPRQRNEDQSQSKCQSTFTSDCIAGRDVTYTFFGIAKDESENGQELSHDVVRESFVICLLTTTLSLGTV